MNVACDSIIPTMKKSVLKSAEKTIFFTQEYATFMKKYTSDISTMGVQEFNRA